MERARRNMRFCQKKKKETWDKNEKHLTHQICVKGQMHRLKTLTPPLRYLQGSTHKQTWRGKKKSFQKFLKLKWKPENTYKIQIQNQNNTLNEIKIEFFKEKK